MLVSEMIDESHGFATMVEQSEAIYASLVKGEMPIETVFISETLIRINEELGKRKMELCARSMTSQFWLN